MTSSPVLTIAVRSSDGARRADAAQELRAADPAGKDCDSHIVEPTRRAQPGDGHNRGVPDRLATELLLIARDPATGRLRRPRRLDIGLRAALFADLLLDQRIADAYGSPLSSTSPNPATASWTRWPVPSRGGRKVAWWRWFRHVRADRDVLVAELVEAGRWTPRRSGMRSAWDDADGT